RAQWNQDRESGFGSICRGTKRIETEDRNTRGGRYLLLPVLIRCQRLSEKIVQEGGGLHHRCDPGRSQRPRQVRDRRAPKTPFVNVARGDFDRRAAQIPRFMAPPAGSPGALSPARIRTPVP